MKLYPSPRPSSRAFPSVSRQRPPERPKPTVNPRLIENAHYLRELKQSYKDSPAGFNKAVKRVAKSQYLSVWDGQFLIRNGTPLVEEPTIDPTPVWPTPPYRYTPPQTSSATESVLESVRSFFSTISCGLF
ncbi:hypothetical protein EB093_05025 [bacterium]|nr:hypothetical protein [bacterium]